MFKHKLEITKDRLMEVFQDMASSWNTFNRNAIYTPARRNWKSFAAEIDDLQEDGLVERLTEAYGFVTGGLEMPTTIDDKVFRVIKNSTIGPYYYKITDQFTWPERQYGEHLGYSQRLAKLHKASIRNAGGMALLIRTASKMFSGDHALGNGLGSGWLLPTEDGGVHLSTASGVTMDTQNLIVAQHFGTVTQQQNRGIQTVFHWPAGYAGYTSPFPMPGMENKINHTSEYRERGTAHYVTEMPQPGLVSPSFLNTPSAEACKCLARYREMSVAGLRICDGCPNGRVDNAGKFKSFVNK